MGALRYDHDSLSHDYDSLPHDHDAMSHNDNTMPYDNDSLPHDHNSLPHDHDSLPHDHDAMCHYDSEEALCQEGSMRYKVHGQVRLGDGERPRKRSGNTIRWWISLRLAVVPCLVRGRFVLGGHARPRARCSPNQGA